jgi:hypothetical protein
MIAFLGGLMCVGGIVASVLCGKNVAHGEYWRGAGFYILGYTLFYLGVTATLRPLLSPSKADIQAQAWEQYMEASK